jgi:hypothetical protein
MSRLKGTGRRKAQMRKWRLPELQHRHREIVESYMQTAKQEIEAAIKTKQVFSNYVLEKESDEFKYIPDLNVLVSKIENAPNPFFGLSQSSKKGTITINIERPLPNVSLGITKCEDSCCQCKCSFACCAQLYSEEYDR